MKKDLNQILQEPNLDTKIQKLQKYLKQQRLEFSQLSLQLTNQELNFSQSVCPNIQLQKTQILNNGLISINNELKEINNILNPLNVTQVGQGINQIKQEIKDTAEIISSIKNSLTSNIQNIKNRPETQKMTNLNSPSWVLDGINIQNLNNQYKKAAQLGSLQICSIQTPYLSSFGQCISLPATGLKKYYSLKTKQFIDCYNYDQKIHQCLDSRATKTNYNAPGIQNKIIIPNGSNIQTYSSINNNAIVCPQNSPFYDGTKCINCQKYFDLQKKKCTTCEGQNTYDLTTHICQIKTITILNLQDAKNKLILSDTKTLNDIKTQYQQLAKRIKIIQCPSLKPFYNDLQCINCNNDTYFNFIQKSCGTCPSRKFFNINTNHCQNKNYYMNLNNSNWFTSKNVSDVLNQVDNLSKNNSYDKCPLQKPFSTNRQCIQCSQNQYFDYEKQNCSICGNGKLFNINLHKCSEPQTNYQTNPQIAPNLIYQGRAKNQWLYIYNQNLQQNPSILDCQKDKPFFDGHSCIICPNQFPYFNLQYQLCQHCLLNTLYNSLLHDCLTTQGNIATQVPTLQKMAAGIFA